MNMVIYKGTTYLALVDYIHGIVSLYVSIYFIRF